MDPWQVLGIESTASYEEANRAYKVRLQLRHPDRHHGAHQTVLDEAARETRDLNEAWELVKLQIASGDRGTHAPPPPNSASSNGNATLEDMNARMEQITQEAQRAERVAVTNEQKLAARRLGLEAAWLRLIVSRALLEREAAAASSDRLTSLRNLVTSSEKLVSSADGLVAATERLIAAGVAADPVNPTQFVRKCAACRVGNQVQSESTRFNCGKCGQTHEISVCAGCGKSIHVKAEATRWTCSCGREQPAAWKPSVQLVRCMCGNRIETLPNAPQILCTRCHTRYSHRTCQCGALRYIKKGEVGWVCTKCRRRNWAR